MLEPAVATVLRRTFFRRFGDPALELYQHRQTRRLVAVRWEDGWITGAVRMKRPRGGGLPVVTPERFAESTPRLVSKIDATRDDYTLVWSLADTLAEWQELIR